MNRRSLLLLLFPIILLFSGCGFTAKAPEPATYPDPVTFLSNLPPSTYEEDSGFVDQTFVLETGQASWCKEYIDILSKGPYELTLLSSRETVKETALYENYYFTYTGSAEVGQINMTETCNIYVGINHYETTGEVYLRVLTAKGFTPVDNGERATTATP